MTMSISTVSSGIGSSISSTSSGLSEETKAKLKSLGLNPDDYRTEADAKNAIAEAQVQQDAMNAQQEAIKVQQVSGSNSGEEIITKAKNLATNMGLSIPEAEGLEDILNKISSNISTLHASAENNKSKLAQVEEYQAQFNIISQEYMDFQISKSLLSNSLNGLANYNKAVLF